MSLKCLVFVTIVARFVPVYHPAICVLLYHPFGVCDHLNHVSIIMTSLRDFFTITKQPNEFSFLFPVYQ